MSKISFNDITPPEHSKSIRDVHLSSDSRQERIEKRAERRMPNYSSSDFADTPRSSKRGSLMIWVSAVVIVVALIIISTFLFIGRTNVNLTARIAHVTLSENVVHTAYKTSEAGELGFTTIEATAEASESVVATETKFVEKKSSGKLTVYNDYGTQSQRIIKNTRFETADGKIYRVHNSFIVPGYTKVGETTTPGKIEITVYADKAGEEYNKNSAKFTIPGLIGDPRFDKFWAETSTSLLGGFSGNRPVVGESNLASTRDRLRTQLKEQIKEQIKTKISADQTLFEDAIFITFESDEQLNSESGKENITVIERASAVAVIFGASNLAEELAKDSNTVLYEGTKALENPDAITFTIVQKEKINPLEDELIQFTNSGNAKFIWSIDTDALKGELAGKPSSILDPTLSSYPGVKDAYVTIRPFWRNNFPTNIEDILIKVESE